MRAITAAVGGVILNLSVWFALHVLFRELHEWRGFGMALLLPQWRSVDPAALLIGSDAMLAMLRFQVGVIRTLLTCAAIGLGLRLSA